MTWIRYLKIGSLYALTVACAAAPVHFHTLVPAPSETEVAQPPSSYSVEVQSVRIPAQVDRLEWVIRRRNGEVALAESELWIAPLGAELRNAVSVGIDHQLRSIVTADADRKAPPMSVRLNVERFESAPERYALIELTWQLGIKDAARQTVTTCRTYAYEQSGHGFSALALAQQRAVALIANQIASAARRLATGDTSVCPAV